MSGKEYEQYRGERAVDGRYDFGGVGVGSAVEVLSVECVEYLRGVGVGSVVEMFAVPCVEYL